LLIAVSPKPSRERRKELVGQAAGSQLVKNTGFLPLGQTKVTKPPIIHNNRIEVGNDTLWTTKVKDSHSAGQKRRKRRFVPVLSVHNPVSIEPSGSSSLHPSFSSE
jgi:hypothetical protein